METLAFRDPYSCTDGLDDLNAHIAAAQRFMPGVVLARAGRGPPVPGPRDRGLDRQGPRRQPPRRRARTSSSWPPTAASPASPGSGAEKPTGSSRSSSGRAWRRCCGRTGSSGRRRKRPSGEVKGASNSGNRPVLPRRRGPSSAGHAARETGASGAVHVHVEDALRTDGVAPALTQRTMVRSAPPAVGRASSAFGARPQVVERPAVEALEGDRSALVGHLLFGYHSPAASAPDLGAACAVRPEVDPAPVAREARHVARRTARASPGAGPSRRHRPSRCPIDRRRF